jgi:hypothetical protein
MLFIVISVVFLLCLMSWAGIAITDKLFSEEYEKHRQNWLDDGEPVGSNWAPPNYGFSKYIKKGKKNGDRCLRRWMRCPPAWIKQDMRLVRLLFLYRTLRWVFVLLLLALFIFFYSGVAV